MRAGELRGALPGIGDLLNVRAHRLIRLQLGEQRLSVAQDDRKDVVEVVGDSSSEPSNRFHFL